MYQPFLHCYPGWVGIGSPTHRTPPRRVLRPSRTNCERVVVTAQRKESGCRVGISLPPWLRPVEANGREQRDDLVRAVPSLKLNAFASSAVVWNVRGVSQNDYGDQQEPPLPSTRMTATQFHQHASSHLDLARSKCCEPAGHPVRRNAPAAHFNSFPQAHQGIRGTPARPSAASASISTKARLRPADNLQFRLAGIKDDDTGYIADVSPGERTSALQTLRTARHARLATL